MPIRNLAELPQFMQPNQCLLGVDYGSKFIGIAISDSNFTLASALGTIERVKFAQVLTGLQKVITERNVGGIVIGLPLTLEGKTGPAAQAARTFASNLEKAIAPNMAFWDERFSSAIINRQLIEVADMSRAKRAAVVDKLAAAYILQGALDFLRNERDRL